MAEIINLAQGRENVFTGVEKYLKEKYSNAFSDCVIVVGYNTCDFLPFKNIHKGKIIIVYQLEQISDKSNLWYNKTSTNSMVQNRTSRIVQWLQGCDIILEYDYYNYEFLTKEGFGEKTLFHPLEYSDAVVSRLPVIKKDIDVLFYGAINLKRAEFLNEVVKHFKCCIIGNMYPRDVLRNLNFKVVADKYGDELWQYINRSKVVLNLHYYNNIQEQVRIFELLCNGISVVSQVSQWNYFGELINEFSTKEEMVNKIKLQLTNDKWKKNSKSITEKFKTKNYKKYKVGAVYNSFYDVDLLEKSISSIRPVVDYVVVVHQKESFYGEKENPKNDKIFNYLKNKGLVDELVIFNPLPFTDKEKSVLEKRNLGLANCRNAGCNFILPIDNDEIYNCEQLKQEIEKMFLNGINTLYCPIRAYYNDEFHYFDETYFVPAVYRIDERQFSFTMSSVLCDPCRKMDEKKYLISQMPMHHLTYLRGRFEKKGVSNLRNNYYKDLFNKVLSHFEKWKDGMNALVFSNDLSRGGELYVKEVELIKTDKMF